MKNEYFITKDLYVASYLRASDCALEKTERKDNITFFCFQRTERLDELLSDYYSTSAVVNPLRYDEALRMLRTLSRGEKTLARMIQ